MIGGVSVWLAASIASAAILKMFGVFIGLSISMRTLVSLSNIYAAAITLLNCVLKFTSRSQENNGDLDAPDEPSQNMTQEKLAAGFEKA